MNAPELAAPPDAAVAAGIVVQPCPFCGFHDVQLDEVDLRCFAVICPECECIGPISRESIDEGIDLWNNAHKIRQLLAARCEALTLNLHSNEKRMEQMARTGSI